MVKRALIMVEGTRSKSVLYVEAARRLGLHPITLAADPAHYHYLEAIENETIRVDTGDLDLLIRECSRVRATYDIAGITSAQEASYAVAGKLCRHFELPGPNPTSIERCCDKFTQRQLLAEGGVPIPAYRLAANATEVESAATEIGLPVIVKPAVGSGSSGVRLCRDTAELAEHASYLFGKTHVWRSSPRILVEEFAQGPYYTVDMMGNEVVGIYDGDFGPPPHFVFREFTLPALLTDEEHERIANVSRDCLRALGLGWGPTCIEFRWTKLGPVVIEVNPRLGGAPGPQMVHLAYGIDLVSEHIKLAIGREWDLRRRRSEYTGARILVPDRDGILDRINGDRRAAAVPGVAEVKIYAKPKAKIIRKEDYRDWIGYVIAVSNCRAKTETILRRAVDLIDWSITPFATRDNQE